MKKHRITVDGKGESFDCPEDSNVLAAMERARCSSIPVGCRNGGCGACRVQVTSGEFHAGKMSRAVISAKEEKKGCVLACRVYPRGDLTLTVLGRAWQNARPNQPASSSVGFARTASNS